MDETQEAGVEAGTGGPRTAGIFGQGRVRLGAVIAVAVAAGFIAWATIGGSGSGSSTPPGQTAQGTNPVVLSYSGLTTLASALQQPIYWIGTKSGTMYELRQTRDAKVYVRYLPPGVKAGDPKALLTVGTYPLKNAFSVTQQAAEGTGAVQLQIGEGAVAFNGKNDQQRAYVAFVDSDYQVEVYSPTPGVATRLVQQGAVKAVPTAAPIKRSATAITPAALKRRAVAIGQPIYWAGVEPNVTYELTEIRDGRIYVRYLPKGVQIGDPGVYLTISTYPVSNAYVATKGLRERPNMRLIKLAGSGIAVFRRGPLVKNVYVAYPGVDYQVEVFDPTPGNARKLVASGQVVPVG